jgi:transposase-like protein
MVGERGVAMDHSTLNRWVIKYAPEIEKQFRCRQRPVGKSRRLDETYVKMKGKWGYLYRTVDKKGLAIAFLLTPTRDRDGTQTFFHKRFRIKGSRRRPRSTRAAVTPQRFDITIRSTRQASPSGSASISTISSSRIIGR